MTDDPVFAQKIAMIRKKFLVRLKTQHADMATLQEQLERGQVPDADLDDLRMQAHMIVGTAGTFGFSELGAEGLALEVAIDTARAENWTPDVTNTLRATLNRFLEKSLDALTID